MKFGIDAGGTLVKMVKEENNQRFYSKYLSTEIEEVAEMLKQFPEAEVALTGGKATYLQSLIPQEAFQSIEFDATFKGIQTFLKQYQHPLENYIFTNVGTGTSIHHVERDKQERAGGTGAGGGMIQGLGYLLTGETDFERLVTLAAQGDRDNIDLKVKHIYKGDKTPIPGELTAANFGRVLHTKDHVTYSDADKLAAAVGVVGETVTTVSIHAAREFNAEYVVYIGSSFLGNDLLKEVVMRYTVLRGFRPYFIENGEYSGALGTLKLMEEN
ncbi:type II pantothenate kinase [Macrococcus carouselicus]|uniref:Type II pantothenate kinase n=1 Tax=Macrococcus carouselicus TaxID=69969 RepID=A0A9Q8CF69_9STAP|nr:type II pantothenate kinase [Macrococcus carouselicus]TDL95423.1 type II pantothenate kinase [Macrococcus carouselicus]